MDWWLIIGVAVIAAAVLGWVVGAYWMRATPSHPDSLPESELRTSLSEPLELTMAVIGFEGSGKTTYLASVFHQLRAARNHDVFLDTDYEHKLELTRLYDVMADPDQKFPDATALGELTEWPFDVCVRTGEASSTKVAKFHYLDFAGESFREAFTGPSNRVTDAFRERLERADILMAILDGYRVKQYLEEKLNPDHRKRFIKDLSTLLKALSDHDQPVNIILSKWDIFESSRSQLAEVVEGLFEIDDFKKFVESREALEGCLLIPVSSVGYGFVDEKGSKQEGASPQPFQVKIPIACALPRVYVASERTTQGHPDRKAKKWANKWNPETDWRLASMGIGGPLFNVRFDRDKPPPETVAQIPRIVIRKFYQFCNAQTAALIHNVAGADLNRFLQERKVTASAQSAPLPESPMHQPTPNGKQQSWFTNPADRAHKLREKLPWKNQ